MHGVGELLVRVKSYKRKVNLRLTLKEIMLNRLLVIILLIITLLCVSACFYSLDGRRVTAREGIEEVVYIYLEEKYGSDKDFKVDSTYGGGSTGVGKRTVLVSSNELPEDTLFMIDVDNITIDNNKYGFIVIPDTDNYIETLRALPIRTELLERLSSKYKREFIPISFRVVTWLNSDDVMYKLTCYPFRGDPEYDYTVIERIDKDNTVDYQDTFFGNIIRSDMEKEIFDLLAEFNYPYTVTYRVGYTFYDDSFDVNSTLTDFKNWITENDPDWHFEVDIVTWLQFVGGNDRGYMGESEPYTNEMYELLRVLEHEYRFRIGIIYKDEFSEEMRTPSNESVYQRSDFVINEFINSDLDYLN